MKTITVFLLTLLMTLSLAGCGGSSLALSPAETAAAETAELESASAGSFQEALNDPEETAAWLDTLGKDERYAWYEEHFGTAFTEHVAKTPYDEKKDIIWFEGYDEIPCDLYALLWYSELDAIILSTFTGDSETIRNACGIKGEMNGETR